MFQFDGIGIFAQTLRYISPSHFHESSVICTFFMHRAATPNASQVADLNSSANVIIIVHQSFVVFRIVRIKSLLFRCIRFRTIPSTEANRYSPVIKHTHTK